MSANYPCGCVAAFNLIGSIVLRWFLFVSIVSIRKWLKNRLRKAVDSLLGMEIPFTSRKSLAKEDSGISIKTNGVQIGDLQDIQSPEKSRLVLTSILHIHDMILDADAWKEYIGSPKQMEKMLWEVYEISANNPELDQAEEFFNIWVADYATPELKRELLMIANLDSEQDSLEKA